MLHEPDQQNSSQAALEVAGTASDVVFLGVVHGLENQTFVPGQRLIETDLVHLFGVSRNSVREGLHRLVAEGVVELLRHKGAAIRSLNLQDTLDVLDVAELMTGLLTFSAARASASSTQARAMKQVLRELLDSDRNRDIGRFSAARREFYRALLDLSGNKELRRLFPSIHMPIIYAQYRIPSLQQLRLKDYGLIANAVLAGQQELAEEAGRRHVQNVRNSIIEASATVRVTEVL